MTLLLVAALHTATLILACLASSIKRMTPGRALASLPEHQAWQALQGHVPRLEAQTKGGQLHWQSLLDAGCTFGQRSSGFVVMHAMLDQARAFKRLLRGFIHPVTCNTAKTALKLLLSQHVTPGCCLAVSSGLLQNACYQTCAIGQQSCRSVIFWTMSSPTIS